jgi:aspartyl-tRNA(Asn)/glutamyl-tRNA(Gln) amidotransferase subunit C
MSLSEQDIQRIAKLARIKLSPPQLATAKTELNQILALLENLRAINTEGVVPMSHAQDVSLSMRADQVSETNQRDAFQSIAPQTEKGLYLVPKVIE